MRSQNGEIHDESADGSLQARIQIRFPRPLTEDEAKELIRTGREAGLTGWLYSDGRRAEGHLQGPARDLFRLVRQWRERIGGAGGRVLSVVHCRRLLELPSVVLVSTIGELGKLHDRIRSQEVPTPKPQGAHKRPRQARVVAPSPEHFATIGFAERIEAPDIDSVIEFGLDNIDRVAEVLGLEPGELRELGRELRDVPVHEIHDRVARRLGDRMPEALRARRSSELSLELRHDEGAADSAPEKTRDDASQAVADETEDQEGQADDLGPLLAALSPYDRAIARGIGFESVGELAVTSEIGRAHV